MADVFYELSHGTITWGPNLMNKVNVSLAASTSLACDLLSLHEGQTEALTLQAQRRREEKRPDIKANQEYFIVLSMV